MFCTHIKCEVKHNVDWEWCIYGLNEWGSYGKVVWLHSIQAFSHPSSTLDRKVNYGFLDLKTKFCIVPMVLCFSICSGTNCGKSGFSFEFGNRSSQANSPLPSIWEQRFQNKFSFRLSIWERKFQNGY